MLCGCGPRKKTEKQKPQQTEHLRPGRCDYEETKNGVTVRAETLDTLGKCIDTFGRKGEKLMSYRKRRIFPVKLTFENSSDRAWELKKENVNLKMVRRSRIFKRLRSWNIVQALSLAGALLGAATLLPYILGPSIAMNAALCGPVLFEAFVPLFFASTALKVAAPIVSLTHCVDVNRKNRKLSRIVRKSWLPKNTVLWPNEKKTFFIFVKEKDMRNTYAVSLSDGNGTITFNCTRTS